MEDAGKLQFGAERFAFFGALGPPNVRMTGDARQFSGDLGRRQHKVRRAELGARATWHVRVLGAYLILRERDAAFGFDGCQAQRPVGAGSRQAPPR